MFRLNYDNVYLDHALSQWRIYPESSSYTFRMALSRNIYMHKLLAMFPDDSMRDRYYTRDMIVPRFIEPAICDYEAALLSGDEAAIGAARDEIFVLAKHLDQVAPRLYQPVLKRYKASLLKGDKADIAAAWREIAEVIAIIPRPPRRVRATLALLRNPAVAKSMFALRRVARPAMLRAFRL
jgi:hypothetical protein